MVSNILLVHLSNEIGNGHCYCKRSRFDCQTLYTNMSVCTEWILSMYKSTYSIFTNESMYVSS